MSHPYASFCDDFYVNLRVGSQLALPTARDTVLHFFEQMRRAFPSMSRFRKSETGEFSLEEDRTENAYRWVSLESTRLSAGQVNPTSIDEALRLHRMVLDLAPHQLGISPIELDYIDVLLGFDLDFSGNHDEVVAESLFEPSPLGCLLEVPGSRPVDYQPTAMIALSADLRLQARLDVITRTNTSQIRTGTFSGDAISVYLTVRRFWDDLPRQTLVEVMSLLAEKAQAIAEEQVLPRIVRPISTSIASRS